MVGSAPAWESFLASWRPDELRGYDISDLDGVSLPRPLRRYYELAGRLPTWNLHLVPPASLTVENGRVLFVVEEQGVYSFETLPDGDDAPVWLVEDDHSVELGEPLSRFLYQYALFEAQGTTATAGWGYVRRDDIHRLESVLPRENLALWPHPSGEVSFHVGVGLIGIVFDTGEGEVEVHATGRSRDSLTPLSGFVAWGEDPLAGSP